MLAGLSSNDKTKLYLDGYTAADFAYLNCATGQQQQHLDYHHQDVTRFQAWKSCLSVLGIPFLDVVRVLAAVLLLGNIQFDQQEQSNSSKDQHRHNTQLDFNEPTSSSGQKKELQAVANLLGVSSTTLYK
ncbi:PREDICTED: chitin synthase 8-like, partial [Rhagoletis zephyria]|uniref:chitin synthase 8-like n=1 Tax=Rhagoletis zephyria TaxID=28612 RepID=UPI000811432F